jgi:antitoxin ParD1/3/4
VGAIDGHNELSLGEHSEAFSRKEIASGRYASASEVMRDGLRALEERNARLEALRAHLAEGLAQAERGEFVDYSLESLLGEVDEEG